VQQPFSRPSHGGNLVWAAALAGCTPSAILDFSASINPLGPPESALVAIRASLSTLRDYPDPEYQALRQALGQQHHLPIEWILPGNGSAELLTWACRELAQLPSTYVLTPGFGDYFRALNTFAAEAVPCALQDLADPTAGPISALPDFTSAFSGLQFQAEECRQVGLLLNNPHNPTGRLFKAEAILPLLQQFGLVVVDEAFMDFLRPHEQQSLIDAVPHHPNLVILRSLTKFYSLPGLRLGYAVAHPDRLKRWQTWRDPWSVNTLATEAAIAVLQDTAFQQQTWNWLASARSQLVIELASIPGLTPLPGAVNFLLVHSHRSVTQLQQQLLKTDRILIRDCLSFPELGDQYFRVAVRTPAENQRLVTGLKAILNAMN
jgi:L-threonine-O-3-phosphate decarboxylase